jgi:hypothetical protein
MRPPHPDLHSNASQARGAMSFRNKLKACCAAMFNPLTGIERELYASSGDSMDRVRIDPAILLLAALR